MHTVDNMKADNVDLEARSTEHHTSSSLHFVLPLYQPLSIHYLKVCGPL